MITAENKMTRRAFADRVRTCERFVKRRALVGASLIAFWLLMMALTDYAKDRGQSYVLFGMNMREVFGGLCMISIGVFVVTMAISNRRTKCPHCRKDLIGVSAQIAVATGNCGNCGDKIFDE